MENPNEKTNPQGGDLSQLKAMFNDYQNKQNQKKRKTSEEILAKYFVPRKNKEIFRILPPKAGKKYIEEAFFHVAPTNASGGKKKHGTVIYCPAHNDPKVQKVANGKPVFDVNGQPVMIPAPCPLCDKAKKLLAQQNPSLKGKKKETLNADELVIYEKNRAIFTEANKWEAKKFYIVRGIDKGAEKDGVKFWRFKHNFKNQGTLDKLLPILREYTEINMADFADPYNGTDLSITMSDSEFNGHVYKQISAITFRGKSLLHGDKLVMQEWLDDNISWREVFQPKKAPQITPYEFLEMVAMGTNPYWDDTDSNNKHWVFPGRPDLEEAANTRNRNLDADEDVAFEQASDLIDDEYPRVTINNITPDKVGEYKDDAVNVGQTAIQNAPVQAQAPVQAPVTSAPEQSTTTNQNESENNDHEYDDLPF